jgi:hypothetical protein
MRNKNEQIQIEGQAAILALKYLYQFIDQKTYSEVVKQVKKGISDRSRSVKGLVKGQPGIVRSIIDLMKTVKGWREKYYSHKLYVISSVKLTTLVLSHVYPLPSKLTSKRL